MAPANYWQRSAPKQSACHHAELIQEFKKFIALTETEILASMRHVPPDELRNAEAAPISYREQMNEAIRDAAVALANKIARNGLGHDGQGRAL